MVVGGEKRRAHRFVFIVEFGNFIDACCLEYVEGVDQAYCCPELGAGIIGEGVKIDAVDYFYEEVDDDLFVIIFENQQLGDSVFSKTHITPPTCSDFSKISGLYILAASMSKSEFGSRAETPLIFMLTIE